jgi:hypothetical protein
MTRSSLPFSSARLAHDLMPSDLQKSASALALQRRRRWHSGLALQLSAALLRLVSENPSRLRLQSAGTMRPFAFLVLATSIGTRLSQLEYAPVTR